MARYCWVTINILLAVHQLCRFIHTHSNWAYVWWWFMILQWSSFTSLKLQRMFISDAHYRNGYWCLCAARLWNVNMTRLTLPGFYLVDFHVFLKWAFICITCLTIACSEYYLRNKWCDGPNNKEVVHAEWLMVPWSDCRCLVLWNTYACQIWNDPQPRPLGWVSFEYQLRRSVY